MAKALRAQSDDSKTQGAMVEEKNYYFAATRSPDAMSYAASRATQPGGLEKNALGSNKSGAHWPLRMGR